MDQAYKVAVLGPIPYDHITTSRGQVIVKYGCATHPAIGLAKLLEGIGTVIPVTHIRKSDAATVENLFKAYPNIDCRALHSYADQGDVIQLHFVDQNNRLEKQTAFMPPIRPNDLADAMDADVFVCVPISDYEVPLDTLQYIKANKKPGAICIFDAHGPTTAVTTTGDRLRRFWVERDMWLPFIDVLKMNIEEAGCSWFQKEYDAADLQHEYQELSEEERRAFAHHALQNGVKALYITLDSRGAKLYYQQNGSMQETFIPSVKVQEVIDTTGCGDSFAGGLAFGLLAQREDYIKAAQYANALGARRTQGTTFDVFLSLDKTNELIRQNYLDQARV